MQDEPETTTEQEHGEGKHIQQAERWMNDHGRPSYDFMMNTAEKGNAEAVETIANWAQDFDVDFDGTVPLTEMVQRIWLAMGESNSDASYS
jgi:hypothetical protein